MKLGLFGGAMQKRGETADSTGYDDFVDYVIEADRLGYEGVFIVEHHFSGIGQISASMCVLSYLAGRTKNIRLGTAVMVLPWHDPILLAEQAATLDMVSGGRFDFGVGKGYRDIEFKGFCIPKEEGAERYDETLALMKKAWTSEERFSYHSDRWHYDDIVVEPAPIQRPHMPLWTAAGSPDSISKVAHDGMKILLDQFGDFKLTEERVNNFRKSCDEVGRKFDPMYIGLSRTIMVTDSQEETERVFVDRMERQKHINQFGKLPGLPDDQPVSYDDPSFMRDNAFLIGQPHEIVAGLRRLEDMGVGYVLMTTIGDAKLLERVSNEIMCEFRVTANAAE